MRFSGPLRAGIICFYFLLFTTKLTFSVNNKIEESSTESSTSPISNRSNQTVVKGSKMKVKNAHYTTVPYVVLRRIRDQINVTRQQIKSQIPTLQRFYNSVRTAFKGVTYNYEWLPKEHLSWYKNETRHLSKKKKLKMLIPNLYRSLLNFSVTFEELKTYDALRQPNQNSVYLRRMEILNTITDYLKQVLSEIEYSLNALYLERWILKTNASQVIGNSSHWNWKPGQTAVMIQDWSVLTLYYRFLKDWLQILNDDFLNEFRFKSSSSHRHRHNHRHNHRYQHSHEVNDHHNNLTNNNNNNNKFTNRINYNGNVRINKDGYNSSVNANCNDQNHTNISSTIRNCSDTNISSTSVSSISVNISGDIINDNNEGGDNYSEVTSDDFASSLSRSSSTTVKEFSTTFRTPSSFA